MNIIFDKPITLTGRRSKERSLNFIGQWVDPISTENNPWRRRLILLSTSPKRKITLRKLFSKFLWSSLFPKELEVLFNLAMDLNDELILEALRLRGEIPFNLLRARINALLIIKGKRPLDLEYFLNSNDFILKVEEENIYNPSQPKYKYNGWARHQNDHGSLRSFQYDPEPLQVLDNIIKINIRSALTVGRILFETTGGESSLTMALNRAETVKYLSIIKELLNERT